MAFDGCLLNMVTAELSICEGSFVDKIFQPSKDEFVFLLRTKKGAKRLFISAHPGSSRIHFTETAPENPPVPPMFCMLLRKHLGSSRILAVESFGLERIVKITFSATNEMGDRVNPSLIAEFIGTSPNIILLGQDLRIIDCLRRSDLEKKAESRIVQPGAVYTPPAPSDKTDLTVCTLDEALGNILSKREITVQNAIVESLAGVSPATAMMICNSCGIAPTREVASLSGWENILLNALESLKSCLEKNSATPTLFKNKKGDVSDFGFSFEKNKCELTFSKMLDEFYTERERLSRTAAASRDLIKLVANFQKRSIRKLNLRMKELESCKDRENLRLYGELLKANLHCIQPGSESAEVMNYYDENMSMITIPLKPELSPSANASRYFKEYKKACTAEHTLRELIDRNTEEIEYLSSVHDSLIRADSVALLDDIREELVESGYLKQHKRQLKKKTSAGKLTSVLSPSGLTVYIGKNNYQNDYLTTKFAAKEDIWFHTKNIAGSHVVLATDSHTPSDDDYIFAATLAAKNSKAASSPKVDVDYTEIKNIKKPSGAKPGMVIYRTNYTVTVNPTETAEKE